MIDKLAGLPTQIRQLEKRLKEMDASKVKPSLVKEITDTIKNLKDMLKEKMDKREERRKAKEQKAQEVAKEAAPKVEDGNVVMPKKEFVEEHEKLVKELEPMVEEHKEQGAELKEVKESAIHCPVCGGVEFATYADYKKHHDEMHGDKHPIQAPPAPAKREYTPMDPLVKKDIVKNVEKKLGPAIISEKEEKPSFKLDDEVEPIRGEESIGKVMRWDGKPSDLVYVAWESGPLSERDGFGGYYPSDLKLHVEEKVAEEVKPEEKKEPAHDAPDHNCGPEYYRASCPNCKSLREKHADLKTNYEALLKDLKEEREIHYTQGNHKWVERLDQKIKDLEHAIAERFPAEKQSAQLDHHESDLYILPNSIAEAKKIEEYLKSINHSFKWVKSDVAGQEWQGKMFIEVPFGKELEPKMREYFANTPLKTKNVEEIMAKKEAGAQNAEHLTVMDHTPARANTSADEIGKDTHDEMQDEWAEPARDVESAKGVPGSLFDVKTAPHVVEQLNSFLNAPYVRAQVSTLGGDEHVSIVLTISVDPKETWVNGILENSRYGHFYINNDGEVEQFSGAFAGWKQPNRAFRKTNVKDVQQLIDVLNAFLAKVNAAPKQASLRKQSVMVNVFRREWEVIPQWKEGGIFKGYDVMDDAGRKVMHLAPVNGKQMNKEMLEWAIGQELTRGLKQAKLVEKIAFLDAGTEVYVLATDKAKKRVKFASLEHGVRGWVSESKIQLLALESQTVRHGEHSDKVLGSTATETLLDCVEGGPIWVNSTELLDANRPPATPEAYPVEEKEAAEIKFCPRTGCGSKATFINKTPEGANRYRCNNCNRFFQDNPEYDKKGLKTALPPVIPNQRGYLDNPPVEKKAAEQVDTKELELYAENERDLYEDFMANVDIIGEMIRADSYDRAQALSYWIRWYTKAANKYEREFPGYVVPEANIVEAAKTQEPFIKQEILNGQYGDVKAPVHKDLDVSKLPVMDVEKAKDDVLNQLAKETDPEKKKSLERRYKHLTMASLKQAAGCDQCNAAMINGVFCHETGCPNNKKRVPCSQCGFEGCFGDCVTEFETEASLNKQARVVHQKDGWHVLSEKGKNLGGPYETKGEAVKRLRQVEYFKHHGSQRPFSKKEAGIPSDEWCGKCADTWAEHRHKDKKDTSCTSCECGKFVRENVGNKKTAAVEVATNPYEALTAHIENMRTRMDQVQQKIQSQPVSKKAGVDEKHDSELSVEEIFEDVAMGLDLLESKLKDESESEELNKNLEELENLLFETEKKVGIKSEPSEEEKKEEPELREMVKEVVKEVINETEEKKEEPKEEEEEIIELNAAALLCSVEGCNNKADSVADGKRYCYTHSWGKDPKKLKEAALPTAIAPTLSNPAPAANATPAVTPDDKKTSCALCGGMTFSDFTAYQQHMEYTHAGDTMPTTPAQKNLPTTAAVQVTDETIQEGTGIPPVVNPATPAPVIKNVQPTDDDNLELSIPAPTSPLPIGQKWVFDTQFNKYVAMPDPAVPGKTI